MFGMKFEGITFITPTGKMPVLEVDKLNPFILTGGSPERIEKVAKFLENAEVLRTKRGHAVVTGYYQGLPISAASIGMGPGSATIVLPEIIECIRGDFGVILRLGTSGALQPFVKKGHIHIPTCSIRDEGTTQAVIGLEYPAVTSPELIPILILAASKVGYRLGKNLWIGPVHTKDDLYFRETPRFSPRRDELRARLRSFKEMGVISSEMEFSAYCILRDYYERYLEKRILTGGLLSVISEPEEEGRIDVRGVDMNKMEEDMIKIGLEVFVLIDRLKEGEDIGLDQVILEMMSQPPRSRLLK